jgi:hypothetical protein
LSSFPDDIKKNSPAWKFGGIRLLGRYGKLLLGAYILRKLKSGNSHEVSGPEKNGMLSKYGKMILGAYLMKKLRTGKYFGTREHEESTGGLLQKYGKLMLTTYAVKKLRSGKSHEEVERSKQDAEPSACVSSFLSCITKKYGKWLLSAYLIKRLHNREPKTEEVVETETYEEKEPSMINFNKIIICALAGVTAVYAIKKYKAKNSGYKIEVE